MRAVGACAAIRDRGGSVPEDVSVSGIDDISLANLLYPPLTTVHQPIEELSEVAVDILVSRLSGDALRAAQHLVLQPHLVVRGSTAPPRSRNESRV